MLDERHGTFDFCVAMDSLIHYPAKDLVNVLAGLADRTQSKVLFTFAPKTLALSVMHTVGKVFPRSDRSPAIEPVGEKKLSGMIAEDNRFTRWRQGQSLRIVHGFYTSHAKELIAS